MSRRSKKSIGSMRSMSISRKHKVKTSKNSKKEKYVSLKKTRMDFNKMKTEIEHNIELMEISQKSGNLEVYTYANKILIVLILQLMAHGTKKSIDMANYYKEKTGIEIDKKSVNRQLSKLPTLKNTIQNIYDAHNNPPMGSIASGWRW